MKLSPEQLKKIKEDFPSEALSTDSSRGFALTSIKAAYVIERLNDVFGVCGWSFSFTPFETLMSEVITLVTLKIGDHEITQAGGKKIIKEHITDARKSSVTDGLTKCASILGIGHSVFKGHVKVGEGNTPIKKAESKQPDKINTALDITGMEVKEGKTGNTAWKLYLFTASDNFKYSTFDKKIAEELNASHEFGKKVEIAFTQTAKGRNITGITVVDKDEVKSICTEDPETCDDSEYQDKLAYCNADKGRRCKFDKENTLNK